MQAALSTRPDLKTLTAGLRSVLNDRVADGQLTVLERAANSYSSGCPSEIVTCRIAGGTDLRLLCKYELPDGQSRGDVDYEATVYRHVVERSGLSAPKFYGSHIDPDGRKWLVLEYLADGTMLNETLDADFMWVAASWLGSFHAAQDKRVGSTELGFLKVYDAEYYAELARRTLRFAGDLNGSLTWLPALGKAFEEFACPLVEKSSTVTHGDFYLHNLLWKDGNVYPLDWELAGIKLGEWDLACLTDGWMGETARRCVSEYRRSRWPGGAPPEFDQTVGAGRLCLYFYNLGTDPDWACDAKGLWYSQQLRAAGEEMSLI